jgi:hypothetical protein
MRRKKPKAIVLALLAFCGPAGAAARPLGVSIQELMAHPQQFDGKRVSFIGYWDTDGHAMSLRSDLSIKGSRIFSDFTKPRIPVKTIQAIPHGSWVRVVGTFRYINMTVYIATNGTRVVAMGFGWMNDYDKEVTDITEFTRAARPSHLTNR